MKHVDIGQRIRALRVLLEEKRREAADLERQLAALLAEAGRRPGDGSDQGRLFDVARQPTLFGG